MRKKRSFQSTLDEPSLDISSLIDVCFLLLIYFIVTSTIAPQEKDLPMTLAGIPENSSSATDNINVLLMIRDDGTIVMNQGDGEEILDRDPSIRNLPLTSERIQLLNDMAESSGVKLVAQIAASDNVNQQRFIDVLNCLRGKHVNNVTLTDFYD